jgi:DNA-binding response OmpR family regulator
MKDAPTRVARPKLLVVDDQAPLIQSLYQVFKDDHQVFMATDGKTGVEIAKREHPDVILLDVMMPGMSGFDVCQTIRSKIGSDVYIILLTAQGQEYDKHKGKMAGADTYITKAFDPDHITKPFDPDQLLAKASSVLGI